MIGPMPEPKGAPLVETLDREQKKVLYEKLGVYERAFSLGFLSFMASVVIVTRWPQHTWIWYIVNGLVYIPWRWLRFFQQNKEWYLMDFCYFVPYTMLGICIIEGLAAYNGRATYLSYFQLELFRAYFAFSNGALVLSVLLLGNRIVLHDVDSTTGLFIHFAPGVLFWTLRWGGGYGTSRIEEYWPGVFKICEDMIEADISVQSFSEALWYTGPCSGSINQFATWPGLVWIFIWGIPYYLIMFCCLRQYFEEHPEKDFMFRDLLKDTKVQGRILIKLPPAWQPLGFMVQHFLWTALWGFVSIVLWNSYLLHSAFLTVIFLIALHNGSAFLFREVAAKRIQNKVVMAAEEAMPMRGITSFELAREL